MNNNQDQMFYEDRPTKAADFRRVARNRLKGFWWTAILVTLIASLLGGIATGISFSSSNSYTEYVEPADGSEGSDETLNLTPEDKEAVQEALINFNFEPAKELLSEKYPMFTFVLSIIGIVFLVIFVLALAFNLFVSSPVKVGYQRFCLEVLDGNKSEIRVGTLFRFFRENYGKTIGLNFVHGLIMELTSLPMLLGFGASYFSLVKFLPEMLNGSEDAVLGGVLTAVGFSLAGAIVTLCISIPVSYSYSMAHMIMADYPGVGAIEALRLSRQMMKGNKWRLFCLDFSFIGWYLLGVCACGLGVLIVTPYQYVARAAFYHEISGRKTPEDVEFPSINPDDYMI